MLENKAYFSIPDFYNLFNLNMNLLSLMETEPGLFREGIVIDSVYGAFPGSIWNSGRAMMGGCTRENIIATVGAFAQKGVSVRYTYTNSQITGRNLLDYYCNSILEITEGLGKNGVTVNMDILADHIKKSFPGFYLVWSTTKGVKDIKSINQLSENNMSVLFYGMNNTDVIPKLTHPENIEVLVNEACIENCPDRMHHYADIGKHQLLQESEGFKCPHGAERYFYYDTVVKRAHYISPDDVWDKYIPVGITHFKLSGRNDNPINVIENYARYFAKPEHVDNVRNKLLINHFSG